MEEKEAERVVIVPPLSLEEGLAAENSPNLLERILTLFKNVRPGSDLTLLQLPPVFNMPKSQLQFYGETIYCSSEDLLAKCARGRSPLERFMAVVAWSISTVRPTIFGACPFNPILGETHHVSRGTLNFLFEQVSHHPPVTALHATDEKENVELIWTQNPIPKFHGTLVEALLHGKMQLKLLNYGEVYEMNTPDMNIRLFPVPGNEWFGNVRIRCKESDLEAELCYKGHSFLGLRRNSKSVKGRIFHSSSLKTVYEINGHWDRVVTLKDVVSGNTTILYNAKEALSTMQPPTIKDPKGLLPSESVMVWADVTVAILNKEWDKAREAKNYIEERERQVEKERKCNGEIWVPKHFSLAFTRESGLECLPKHQLISPAPIVVSL